MTSRLRSILPVWIAVVGACTIISVVAAERDPFTWLPLVLAGAILVTFLIQLPSHSTEGFLARLLLGVGGSVVIVAAVTAVLSFVRG